MERVRKVTPILDAARGVEVEIEIAMGAAEAPDIDDTAKHPGRRQILIGKVARDLIDNDIDARAIGGL
jgi:hypothetical protein